MITGMDEEGLTQEVLRRLEATPDARLREVMTSLVRHLHGFAREVRLTQEEWAAGVRFLTECGHATTATRQEWILLSDTLGLSMLVDQIDHAADERVTESTIFGPFYVEHAPDYELGDSIALTGDGQPTRVSGRVLDVGGQPVDGAVLEVWQTAPNGLYDVQDPEQPEGNLRGRFRTGADGRYAFRTVRPVPYPIPDDGPVGGLLAATGRHPWRAAHIHVLVSAEGCSPVATHIFDAASDYLDSDTVFGVKPSLIKEFVPAGGGFTVECDFVLAP